MKKIFSIVFMMLLLTSVKAQLYFQTCANVHGYWTEWKDRASFSHWDYKIRMYYYKQNETFNGLQFTDYYSDEWNWLLKINITNYVKPDKKEIKRHLKNEIWYEYSGTVEYYVSDEFPTITKVLEHSKFPFISPTYRTKGSIVKRTAKAIIKIAPYKKTPCIFNVFFDDCGIAFTWGSNFPFEKKYFIK